MNPFDKQLAQRWFWRITILHVMLWTCIPTWIRYALPMDAAEGAAWGHNLEWGYDRNPWLNAWLTRLAIELGGNSDIFVYFFSQLCVGLAFWSIWKLGQNMVNPLQAVVSVLMLEAVQYYTLAVVDFNDNGLELGLWPLLALLFYRAITLQKIGDWIGVGIISGLALMAKYYTGLLLFSMACFLLWDSHGRASFKKSGPYLAFLIFSFIIFPHVIWLFQHHGITIEYAFERVQNNHQAGFWHFIQPALSFAILQIAAFLGAIVLLSLGLYGMQRVYFKSPKENKLITHFNKKFLWIIGVGPYLLTVIIGVLAGWQLHTLWGTPLLSLWGLLFMIHTQPVITPARFYHFLITTLVTVMLFVSGYAFTLLKPGSMSSANFPAKLFAQQITDTWHRYNQTPLRYVVGDRVLTSYVSRYSSEKPNAYFGWEDRTNPWIDPKAIHVNGAIFIQPFNGENHFSESVLKKFPTLKFLGIQHISYERPGNNSKSISVLVGILLPEVPAT